MRTLRIELPPGLPLLNLNDRISYSVRKVKTAAIRYEAYRIAYPLLSEPFGKVRVRVIFRAPDSDRRDFVAGNWAPSIKAALDGIVDAGIIPDDNDDIITEMTLVRGENTPGGQLVIEITEAG